MGLWALFVMSVLDHICSRHSTFFRTVAPTYGTPSWESALASFKPRPTSCRLTPSAISSTRRRSDWTGLGSLLGSRETRTRTTPERPDRPPRPAPGLALIEETRHVQGRSRAAQLLDAVDHLLRGSNKSHHSFSTNNT